MLVRRARLAIGGSQRRWTGRYGKKSRPSRSGAMSPRADVRPRRRRQSLGVAGGGHGAIEVELRLRGQHVRDAVLVDPQAVDLLEQTGAVGIERLAGARSRRLGKRAIALPRLAVGLPAHVGQRIQAILRTQRHLVDRDVLGSLALPVKDARRIEVAVGRRVELGRVALERMRAELLDVDRHRRGQTLGPERVEAQGGAVGVGAQGQAVLRARLVARDQGLGVLDGGGRPREDRDLRPGRARIRHQAIPGSSLRRG